MKIQDTSIYMSNCPFGGGGATLLPNTFWEMRARRNLSETQQPGHDQRSGPEIKNRSNVKNGAPEKLICRTIQQKEVLRR